MSDSMLFAPRRLLQTVAALGLAAFTGIVASSGCKSTPTPAPFCEGGFVRDAPGASPTCEGLCEPSKCANPSNVCVDNDCELTCTSILDCESGQDCVPAKTDGTGAAVTICQNNGKAAFGTLCPFDNECTTLLACPDGSACTTTNCAASACKPLVCLSTGIGDPTAYCTLQDCHTDTDCPGGYWCETARDPHQICGSPAPPASCGTTKDPCVDLAMNAANGTTFAAGSVCTERNVCVLRQACDPCTTDVDCSLTPGQHCVNIGGSNACALDCSTDADCIGGYMCTSNECVPRSGACVGAGKYCDSCRVDGDCASGALCIQLLAGGEHVCFTPNLPCTTNTNCPTAPDGTHGQCLDEVVDVGPGDSGYDTCYVPYILATDAFDCWCGNSGTGCFSGSDCCSKVCTGGNEVEMVTGTCK
jgi:hypothetical protein